MNDTEILKIIIEQYRKLVNELVKQLKGGIENERKIKTK